jgi:hypothetical protein
MPQPLQLPDGTVLLSNRFGHGPFEDFQRFVRVVVPQGIEIEGVYERLMECTLHVTGSMPSYSKTANERTLSGCAALQPRKVRPQ